ncbi:hypothetical protein PSTG_17233 [Puccinia striiformis f. sp. tritici PST-78]|uniref:Retrotransposon gag domain-containing protein n=1 Tax=Puccinia striiformis f. sp. tritici PST-78 TaxID=1165861 RepID=A0A0L0UQV9_9BASI|nr:hypothetical protein PSTG_17233 [Puccinia striiformis f. sp. tritici PST-78]
MSSTRSTANDLQPLADPEALIQAASAARRKAKITAALQDQNPIAPQNLTLSNSTLHNLPALPPSPTMPDPPSINTASDDSQKIVHPFGTAGGSNTNQQQTRADPLSLQEYLKGIIQLQHRSIDQANLDRQAEQERRAADAVQRQADAERIARLEESMLLLAVKREPTEQPVSQVPARPEPGRLDLQQFRIEGPLYTDTSQAVEPFITWIEGVEIAFTTKGITRDDDKICVVGLLIREGRTQRFYAQGITKFLEDTWANFKTKLIAFALPPLWRTDLREKFRHLKMTNTESFLDYSSRSRTLQNMLNFGTQLVSDFDLAESMTLGMIPLLRTEVNNHQVLLQNPFDFSTFENRCSLFWGGILLNRAPVRSRPPPSSTQSSSPSQQRSKEENIWRVHAYLDSLKLCRFCRKQCGSAAGACTGTMDRSFVHIPASFVAPPIPADWKPPVGLGSTSSQAGRPTQPPAGRPSARSATVSGVAEESTDQNLDVASLSAISAMDYELQLALSEGYVPPLSFY